MKAPIGQFQRVILIVLMTTCESRDSPSRDSYRHFFFVQGPHGRGDVTWLTIATTELAVLIGAEREHVTRIDQYRTVIRAQAHVEHAVLGKRLDGRRDFLAVHLQLEEQQQR